MGRTTSTLKGCGVKLFAQSYIARKEAEETDIWPEKNVQRFSLHCSDCPQGESMISGMAQDT